MLQTALFHYFSFLWLSNISLYIVYSCIYLYMHIYRCILIHTNIYHEYIYEWMSQPRLRELGCLRSHRFHAPEWALSPGLSRITITMMVITALHMLSSFCVPDNRLLNSQNDSITLRRSDKFRLIKLLHSPASRLTGSRRPGLSLFLQNHEQPTGLGGLGSMRIYKVGKYYPTHRMVVNIWNIPY